MGHVTSTDLARHVRRHVLHMVHRARASHVGTCLSIADILAVLYADVLAIDAAAPAASDRDPLAAVGAALDGAEGEFIEPQLVDAVACDRVFVAAGARDDNPDRRMMANFSATMVSVSPKYCRRSECPTST